MEKFQGYSSSIEGYTFRSTFEELYLETTPSKFLPDPIKNNFLVDPSLSLVKNLQEIDDIWRKLQQTYGNTKIMLSRKLESLAKSDLSRTRDLEKLVHLIIRDAVQIAKRYKI